MFRGETSHNPELVRRRDAQENERFRRAADAEARNRVIQSQQDRATNNALEAQEHALTQLRYMTANPSNPRTVTDTSMQISGPAEGGVAGGSSSGSRRTGTSGGFGSANPQIDGRYMNLASFQEPEIDKAPPPPQVQMGEGNFTPTDAKSFQDAAFSRLKDRAGSMGKSAIDSLAAQLGSRGIGDSGTFARGTANEIVNAVQPLSDLNVAHLGEEYDAAERSRTLSENARLAQYTGGIQQRGQDMSSKQALNNLIAIIAQNKYQGEQNQRGQDLDQVYRMLGLNA